MNVWGVHNDALGAQLLDDGFISIGWDRIGDARTVGLTREALKGALARNYPDNKPGAIAGWAGIFLRFCREMQEGDLIVAPYRPDGTINLGIVTGPYEYHPEAEIHQHRRPVRWEKTGVSRTVFTREALHEIGCLLTVFGVRRHTQEFIAVFGATDEEQFETAVRSVEQVEADTGFVAPDEPSLNNDYTAEGVERRTKDHVLTWLKDGISPLGFEEFTADLLRAMGYEARTTSYSQDGGVDVIAHRDPLGLEPPLIKVQCKQMTTTIGAPPVQQLVGTQAPGELSLFVTLGLYSREALSIERSRQGLRLINGNELVDLVLRNYERLSAEWRTRLRLRSVLVVDGPVDL